MSQVVLLNIAHRDRHPQCERGAAFRILGVFDTVEEAANHAQQLPDDCSIHSLPIRKWTPLMRSEDCSSEEQISHLMTLGERHRQRANAHAEEFAENVAKRQTGKTREVSLNSSEEAGNPTKSNRCKEIGNEVSEGAVSAIPRNSEVRMQHFAVVSIISDDSESDVTKQQPAVLVWAVTETEAEAKDIIKSDLAEEASDVHLDVVAMYEWLHPTAVDPELITEEYRDKRLDELMQHRKTESKRIAMFRKKCAAEGYKAPLISLENPALTTASAPLPVGDKEDEEEQRASLTL